MKTTAKLTLLFCAITVSINTYSQIKVLNSGNVGIGQALPEYRLDVTGSTRLNGYVGINGAPSCCYPFNITSYYGQTIFMDPSSTSNGSIIGTSTDIISFWYNSSIGYNKVYAQSFSIGSDSTIKKNIQSLSSGALLKVLNLRPISFEYKNETKGLTDSKQKKIGLVAQEVENVIPEAVSFGEAGGIKMLDYDMLIPVLIKAIQEQQSAIETLKTEINKLKSGKGILKSTSNSSDVETNIAALEQNTPNPFTQATEIKYFLPETTQKALLYIYDMNGSQIKIIPIIQKGNGSVTINGSELHPGMYLYTLIVDGNEIDTKRMILTQ